MHILFFSHYFPPEGNAPASRTHENCRRWVARGHRVTVITCAPNVPNGVVYPGYRNQLFSREVVDGIEVIRVWTYIAPNKGTVRRIVNYVSYMFAAVVASLFVKRPEIIIGTSPQFFCAWAGLIASWLRRAPFILEIRDIWPESIVAVGAMQNKRLLRLLEWLELKLYAFAPQIVTVGEGYRDRLLEKGVPVRKISIVMNGVDTDVFQPQEPDPIVRREFSLNGEFVCSYVGTIGMAAGLEVVLEAAGHLERAGRRGIAFLLVGDGAEREELEAETARRGLKSVIFAGRLDKARIPGVIAASDACLVHLRNTELFTTVMPSKIFEAAGMAVPILVGVKGRAARMVEEAGAGIAFEPEDAVGLIAAIERLAGDRPLARRMGLAGHANIGMRFTRDRLAEDYLAVIHRVLGLPMAAVAEVSRPRSNENKEEVG